MTTLQKRTLIENRRSRFDYHLEKDIEAGMKLTGEQVKVLLSGKASFSGGSLYVRMHNGEAFLEGLTFPKLTEHNKGLFNADTPTTPSIKLLLHKSELGKLGNAIKTKGKTIVPIRITYERKIKVVISLATGKTNYDKKETTKARDLSRINAE